MTSINKNESRNKNGLKSLRLLIPAGVLAVVALFFTTGFGINNESPDEPKKGAIADADIIKIDLDYLKKDSWSAAEMQNVELITDFVQNLMNAHDFEYVRETFGEHDYTQHSKGLGEGINAVIDYVEEFSDKYPEYTYDVKHMYADGDYVMFHSHSTIKKEDRGDDEKGLNIIDTWRIEDGEIAEHWDAIQAVDGSMRMFMLFNGGKTENSNGLY